jgi:hypothetical protein
MRQAPWNGRYFSRRRIEDWLALLNYQVVAQGYYGNSMLWPSTSDPEAFSGALSQRVPSLRCCYYLVARKRVFPLTPTPGYLKFARSLSQTEPAQARTSSSAQGRR